MHNAVFVGWGLLAAGEAITPVLPEIGSITQMGALGVLSWVAWTQRTEIQKLRDEHKEVIDTLCERWNGWEKTRHDDSTKLNDTLQNMTRHCAETQAKQKA